MVSLGNAPPQKAAEAKMLYVFKKELDIALGAKEIKGDGEKAGTRY